MKVMNKNLIKGITFLAASLVSMTVFANYPSFNPRPRLMSMGGAGLSAPGDRDSAYVNPAGLADLESTHFDVLPILFEFPYEFGLVSDYQDLQDTLDNDSSTDQQKGDALENFLHDYADLSTSTRININPGFSKENFYFGLVADALVSPRLRAGGVTSNQIVELGGSNVTAAVVVAYSRSFMEKRLRVGATVKPVYRLSVLAENEQTVYDVIKGLDPGTDVGKQLLGDTQLERKAFGLGVDLGAQYQLPFFEEMLHPRVGLTYQDIGSMRFFGSDRPKNVEQSLSIGGSVEHQFGIVGLTAALDFRNINKAQEMLNMIHFGAEARFWRLLALRAGLSQLYWTVGAGLDVRFLQLDIFVAAREAAKTIHWDSDRTVGAKIALGF